MTRTDADGIIRDDLILVVDDEADLASSVAELLQESLGDARVVTAADGPAALEILEKGGIDLIISDFRMPGMDGVQLLRQVRRIAPDVPRILITAYPDLDVATDAINDARIEGFLRKPLDPEQLISAVWEALDSRWEKLQIKERNAFNVHGGRGTRTSGGHRGPGPRRAGS